MPGQRLAEQVRGVLCARGSEGALEVVLECGPEIGVRAIIDDLASTPFRSQVAQVSDALLGDDHVDVVLSMVDVGHHGHDTRDSTCLGLRGAEEYRDAAVPGEVGGAPDAVL